MRVIDLFCGCGGMSLGFQNAGFDIVAAYDNWQPAIDIYQKNFQHPIYKKDLSTEDIVPELRVLAPDMIIGGPPCQDFSIAGKREFRGKRANLTLKFGQIVSEVHPQWFVMENVYNIEKSPIFEEVLTIFKSAGYGVTKHVWDASYMEVPQMRRRYFVVGKLGEKDDFLLEKMLSGLSKERMTVRKYFKDKPIGADYIYQHPRTYKRRAIFSIDEPLSTIRSVNRPIPSNYVIHPADKTSDLSKVHVLTTKERSYIQSFPESFEFVGTTSSIEQAIGNAVPVKMAEYVAKIIISYKI
ncbi:MAG: DNA cytosine methyltransferase [Bacteroidaceae bacterium]|nr:DNA cytosine methyltransferase [Bacteroidaceae bacterium]